MVHGSRLSVHGSQFTVHGSWFTTHGSRFTIPSFRVVVHDLQRERGGREAGMDGVMERGR